MPDRPRLSLRAWRRAAASEVQPFHVPLDFGGRNHLLLDEQLANSRLSDFAIPGGLRAVTSVVDRE